LPQQHGHGNADQHENRPSQFFRVIGSRGDALAAQSLRLVAACAIESRL
jgi:hypothetical protein